MCMYQYRITVNQQQGKITDMYPGEQWSYVAQAIEDRGGYAIFERRLITDKDILPLLSDSRGFITLKDKVVCPWEDLAVMEVR